MLGATLICMNHPTPTEREVLQQFKRQLEAAFADRVESLQLFGSKARGDATKFSDVDVLIILEHATPADRRTISALTADILTETGVLLSPKTFSPEQFVKLKQDRTAFWQTIQPDLISL